MRLHYSSLPGAREGEGLAIVDRQDEFLGPVRLPVGKDLAEDLLDLEFGVGAELLGFLGRGQARAEDEEKQQEGSNDGSVSVFVSGNRDDRGRAGMTRDLIIWGNYYLVGGKRSAEGGTRTPTPSTGTNPSS